jgi:hypothetical protein
MIHQAHRAEQRVPGIINVTGCQQLGLRLT